jgi:hypothetical protein
MTSPGAIQASVILCDYSQAWQGKLFINGAGINIVGVADAEPPHRIGVSAAVLITVPWSAHNQMHRLKVSLLDEDERVVPLSNLSHPGGLESNPEDEGSVIGQFNAGRAPIMTTGDDTVLPMGIPLQAELPKLGAYHVVVYVDRTELARCRFRVLHASQLGVQPPFGP